MIPLTLTVPTTGSTSANVPITTAYVVVLNLSGNQLYVQTSSQGALDFLPPWTGDIFPAAGTDGKLIISTPQGTTYTSATQVLCRVYLNNEPVPGTYPFAIVSQVSLIMTQQTLTNDGSVNPTTFIEATASGEPASNVTIKNNGNLAFSGRDNNVFTLLLSLVTSTSAAAAIGIGGGTSVTTIAGATLDVSATAIKFEHLAKFLAGLSFGSSLVTDFQLIDDGQNLRIEDGSGNTLVYISNGGAVVAKQQFEWNSGRSGAAQTVFSVAPTDMGAKTWNLVDGTDDSLQWQNATDSVNSLKLKSDGSVIFKQGTGTISGVGYFASTGNGTYSHGAGGTPQMAFVEATGSLVTHFVGSYTATTVVVNLSSSVAFKGMAIS